MADKINNGGNGGGSNPKEYNEQQFLNWARERNKIAQKWVNLELDDNKNPLLANPDNQASKIINNGANPTPPNPNPPKKVIKLAKTVKSFLPLFAVSYLLINYQSIGDWFKAKLN